ncbi:MULTISPECIES: alpha/beta hydrolase [Paenibacillus]|uniref:alpha/beta hydrolase n=1 Tax=Paenibacillus TaxID=44249 RepID=UPI002FE17074
MQKFHQLKIGEREVLLYLPPSYEQTVRHYPVVYVHDGGFLFTNCINYLEHLFRSGRLPELIFVGIETARRNDEYTPWPAESLTPTSAGFGGMGRKYVDEITDVLKPYIDRQYRTLPDAGSTGIIGGSLGGLISWFAGYWRPDVFGKIGLLSPSFWYQGVLDFVGNSYGLDRNLLVYMSLGGCEGIYKPNVQKHMVRCGKEFCELMVKQGFPKERLTFAWDPEGTHDDLFMVKRFPEALQQLFRSTPGSLQAVKENTSCYQIPGTEVWSVTANPTGREYRIFVAVPDTPPPAEGYPVLYSLDGNASFGSLAEAMRLQSRGPHGIPAAVIVGIGYDSNEPLVTAERFRDYTVYAEDHELPKRPGGTAWPETGGADDFLDFLELQLKPEMERRYRINRAKQTLFGHSLGGFVTLYAMITRQGAFQRYAAASPSIWWKNHMLYTLMEQSVETINDIGESAVELLLITGTEEKASMIRDAREFMSRLRQSGPHLTVNYKEVDKEGHVSVLPALISELLRFVTS